MEDVEANLGAIRAAGTLATLQGEHLASMTEYLHTHCEAAGAFKGILGFFAGTYASAVGNAVEGLDGNRRANLRMATELAACADTYEQADQAAHALISRAVSGAGYEVAPYRSIITSPATVVPATAAAAAAADGESSISAVLKQLAVSEAKKILPEHMTREAVQVEGQWVFKDHVGKGVDVDTNRMDRANGFLDRVEDPFGFSERAGNDRKAFLAAVDESADVDGRMTSDWALRNRDRAADLHDNVQSDKYIRDSGQSYSDNARLNHNAREMHGWYDDYKTVDGFVADPLGDMPESYGAMKTAFGDVKEYHDIAARGPNTSVLNFADRKSAT